MQEGSLVSPHLTSRSLAMHLRSVQSRPAVTAPTEPSHVLACTFAQPFSPLPGFDTPELFPTCQEAPFRMSHTSTLHTQALLAGPCPVPLVTRPRHPTYRPPPGNFTHQRPRSHRRRRRRRSQRPRGRARRPHPSSQRHPRGRAGRSPPPRRSPPRRPPWPPRAP